jgi:pyruvate kinase
MILINDGLILLRIERAEAREVVCTVVIGGPLSSHKGVNVPSASLAMSALTQKDKKDLIFGLEHGVDIVSLSFVRCAEHVAEAKKFIADRGAELPVIAKIETQKALDNIDAIIDEAYGIMVARGDLGVETPFETIPLIQESLIKKTNAKAKPVITATQVLTSMVSNSRPTRAEVTDVANAIIEGTDALMLSEETAIGNYPVESVKALARISEAIEAKISYERSPPRNEEGEKRISHAIARAACAIANDVEAVAIITPTRSGASARLVESHRPKQPIIAITPEMAVARRLNLSSGVYPFLSDAKLDIDNALSVAQKVAAHLAIWERDRPVVVTSGPRTGKMGKTDRIKVQRIA